MPHLVIILYLTTGPATFPSAVPAADCNGAQPSCRQQWDVACAKARIEISAAADAYLRTHRGARLAKTEDYTCARAP